MFGDEAAKTLLGPMRNMALMLGELYATVNGISSKNEQAELSSTRMSLQDSYPQMTNEDAYNGVIEKMKTLYKTGEYNNIKDLMTDAARMSFTEASATPDKRDIYAARSAGQPTARSRNSKPSPSMSSEDREDRALDAILNGEGLDGAARAYNDGN